MMFNVPQFIDVEDKIAGPLTAKQLLWMIGMGAAILLVRLFTGGGAVMFILSVPVVIVFVLLAFYRPNGQSLISFVLHGVFYLFRPKVSVWRRTRSTRPVRPAAVRKNESSRKAPPTGRVVRQEDIRRVADMLDRREG